jgi:soluble lytic murein transglycosylase-like protein
MVSSLVFSPFLHAIDCNLYSDIYTEAGKRFNIDPYLIKAVCSEESNEQPGAVNKDNHDHSIDIGACQINSFWFDIFTNDFGIPLDQLKNDAATSIYASGYILAYNFSLFEPSPNTIGGYNAGWDKKKQASRDSYASRVLKKRKKIHQKCTKKAG